MARMAEKRHGTEQVCLSCGAVFRPWRRGGGWFCSRNCRAAGEARVAATDTFMARVIRAELAFRADCRLTVDA